MKRRLSQQLPLVGVLDTFIEMSLCSCLFVFLFVRWLVTTDRCVLFAFLHKSRWRHLMTYPILEALSHFIGGRFQPLPLITRFQGGGLHSKTRGRGKNKKWDWTLESNGDTSWSNKLQLHTAVYLTLAGLTHITSSAWKWMATLCLFIMYPSGCE